MCILLFNHLPSNTFFANINKAGTSDSIECITSYSCRVSCLPSNPEFLLNYFDQVPSDDDSDLMVITKATTSTDNNIHMTIQSYNKLRQHLPVLLRTMPITVQYQVYSSILTHGNNSSTCGSDCSIYISSIYSLTCYSNSSTFKYDKLSFIIQQYLV